jgi:hypothetical protein
LAALAPGLSRADPDYAAAAGDFDEDGITDVLLKAKHQIVMIASGIIFPVMLPKRVPTVAFQEACFGSGCASTLWTITRDLEAHELTHSSWSYDAYTVMRIDLNLDGNEDFFIRARQPDLPSFIFFYRHAKDFMEGGIAEVTVDQVISIEQLGVGLGEAGVEVTFQDINGDGRPDMVVRRNGVLAGVFYSNDFNGLLTLPRPSSGSGVGVGPVGGGSVNTAQEISTITMLWDEFLSAVESADTARAALHVSTSSRQKYAQLFALFGSSLPNLKSNWSGFKAIDVNNDFAVFAVEQSEAGQLRLYTIHFVYENGFGWRIDQM